MASAYALPPRGGASDHGHVHHQHSRSYSGSNSLHVSSKSGSGYESVVRKAASNSNLYTHAEQSRDNTPLASPTLPNHHHHHAGHSHNTYSISSLPMKSGRTRGESDLGRPANGKPYKPTLDRISSGSYPSPSPPSTRIMAALLPLPFILVSIACSYSLSNSPFDWQIPLSAFASSRVSQQTHTQHEIPDDGIGTVRRNDHNASEHLAFACALASAAMLLLGALGKLAPLSTGQESRSARNSQQDLSRKATAVVLRATSIALPIYASVTLGGSRVGLVLLLSFATNMADLEAKPRDLAQRKGGPIVVLLLSLLTDLSGWTLRPTFVNTLLGYLALACSIFVLPIPFSTPTSPRSSTPSSRSPGDTSWLTHSRTTSPLIKTSTDAELTLFAGLTLLATSIITSFLFQVSFHTNAWTTILALVSAASLACSLLLAKPAVLQRGNALEAGAGSGLAAIASVLFSPGLWPGLVLNVGLAALSFFTIVFESNARAANREHDENMHSHAHNTKGHAHIEKPSILTKFLLSHCEPGSLLFGILSEKDSRRIAYFTT